MLSVGSSLEDFVKGTLKQIKNGVGLGFQLSDSVNFDLEVAVNSGKEGGVNINVLGFVDGSGHANLSEGHVQRVSFKVFSSDSFDAKLEQFKHKKISR